MFILILLLFKPGMPSDNNIDTRKQIKFFNIVKCEKFLLNTKRTTGILKSINLMFVGQKIGVSHDNFFKHIFLSQQLSISQHLREF